MGGKGRAKWGEGERPRLTRCFKFLSGKCNRENNCTLEHLILKQLDERGKKAKLAAAAHKELAKPREVYFDFLEWDATFFEYEGHM